MSEDRADMAYWFPILEGTGMRVPHTKLVRCNLDLSRILDGKPVDGWNAFIDELKAASGSFPVPFFLRTGHGSGKHDWKRTCYVTDRERLAWHVGALVEWCALCDLAGHTEWTFAVREMLDTAPLFTLPRYGDMPLTKERRYFVEGGKVLCRHPYWPLRSVEQGGADKPNWRAAVLEMNDQNDEEIDELTELSELASQSFEGAWSLDWLQDKRGLWWAIDMAPAERSYHWDGCPRSAK